MSAFKTSYRDALGCQDKQGTAAQEPMSAGLPILRAAFDRPPFHRETVNPFHQEHGDILPRCSFRNHQGLLVKPPPTLNLDPASQATVAQEISLLSAHVVLACVVDENLHGLALTSCWDSMHELAAPERALFHRQLNSNFVYVGTDSQDTTNRLLTTMFHHFNGGYSKSNPRVLACNGTDSRHEKECTSSCCSHDISSPSAVTVCTPSATPSVHPMLSFDHTEPNLAKNTVMEESHEYSLGQHDPLTHTARSENYYSNGECQVTPDLEWNGWERVRRTKKPFRHRMDDDVRLTTSLDTTMPQAIDVDSEVGFSSGCAKYNTLRLDSLFSS
ncbi:hypothetical protein AXG93_2090s1080 [Marchantia polymorpha subsp. ruderalis]|uniref:Uncharacterized protein n=1 Tax=Marchantia polymorpha subsp. ruderalis TaxID=1480154 RepID=A0A176WAG1_MARPO|nr:hypothetical protein AXG93_2090s1080 [Marchantia polymorpha subsp. ruderalis]